MFGPGAAQDKVRKYKKYKSQIIFNLQDRITENILLNIEYRAIMGHNHYYVDIITHQADTKVYLDEIFYPEVHTKVVSELIELGFTCDYSAAGLNVTWKQKEKGE